MDRERHIELFRPIIHRFFEGPKTFSCYLAYLKENKEIPIDLFESLRFMTVDVDYPEALKKMARKIILQILKKDWQDFDQMLESFIKEKNHFYTMEKEKAIANKVEKAIQSGEPLIDLRYTKNDFYWTKILNDMNDDDYDEVIKNLFLLREEMKKIVRQKEGNTKYSIENIDEYIDINYIQNNLFHKQYKFLGLFHYIFDFLKDNIHPALHKSLEKSKSDYFDLLEKDCIDLESCTNETTLELLKFLLDHFYLYIEINDSMDFIAV